RPSPRQLLFQPAQGAADLRSRDACRHQPFRGSQQDEVLERKPKLPPGGPRGGEETGSSVGSDLRGRETEEAGDLLGGIARHRLRAGGLALLGWLGFGGALDALGGLALAAGRALALGE